MSRRKVLPPDPRRKAVLDAYALTLDPARVSMRDYLETHSVENEKGELVPFRLRPYQARLVEAIEAKWAEGRAFYGLVIKAGQLGYSTLIEMLLAEGAGRHPGCKGLTVAHDVESTKELFSKVDFAVNQTPAQGYDAAGIVQQNASGNMIRFRHYGRGPRDENRYQVSQCRVMTAKKKQGSRSGTVQRMHLSEWAHWEEPGRIDSFQRSVHDERGHFLIVETTALGRGPAYTLWNEAVAGIGDFVPIFTAWWEHDLYSRPFRSARDRKEFILSIGKATPWRYGGAEEENLFAGKIGYVLRGQAYGFKPLTPEQMHWRRSWIDNNAKGNLGFFHQEMPSFPEEAFQFSGLPVFNTAKLKGYERVAERLEPKARQVRLSWDPDFLDLSSLAECPVKIADDPIGPLTLFRDPKPGTKCVFSVDVAEGLEPVPGKGDTDYTACYVLDWHTGEAYARYHARTEPEDAAIDLFQLSRLFGDAWGMPEANGPGLALIKLMEREGFTRFINRPRFEKTVDGDGSMEMRPGFKTTRSSKPWLITQLRKWVDDLPDATGDEVWTPIDALLLREMFAFIKSGKGKLGAEHGKHDDLVIARALAELARHEVDADLLSEVQPDMTETANFLGKANLHPMAEAYDPTPELEPQEATGE